MPFEVIQRCRLTLEIVHEWLELISTKSAYSYIMLELVEYFHYV